MPDLVIYRSNGQWMSDCLGTPQEAEVKALFGTTILPTPWTDQTPGNTVAKELARLNPGYNIVIMS